VGNRIPASSTLGSRTVRSDAVSEQELRRHLDEAHQQLLERDNAYRFHEEELRGRDHQIEQLRKQLGNLHERLAETQAWAKELETNVHDMQVMQETHAWRLAVRLRSLRSGARWLLGR
jgi:peptidoglycan hydrolase CwlO-like protein